MTEDILIEVTDLVRHYGEIRAVEEVSFSIRRGEVLGFLGPNGAGKTTAMQMISGTLAPSAGAIKICGVDLLEQPKRAKAAIGYLPEQPPLYRELTVDEFLGYCARLHRVPRAQRAQALARAKRRCGIETVGHRLIGNLSKGYQQRVGIAQAIVHSPAVVILDEPTVGLDPIQIVEIRALIRELRADHSVLLSTHILPEVQAVCDRVLVILQGRLVLDDTIENLTQGSASASLRIALRQPPPIASLRAIAGVDRVDQIDPHRFRVRHRPDSSPATALAECAATERWGLYELIPEARSLEETFVQLICGEAPGRSLDQPREAA